MGTAVDLLSANPLLLLFVVAGLGYVVGRIRIRGFGLGVAAVLFAGLAVGALDPRLALPEVVYQLGLVLFVYTIGLASGPGFFAGLRRRGLRDSLFALGVLGAATGAAWAAGRLLNLPAPLLAGLYAGSLTNTPALAAVLERLGGAGGTLALPAVGYSLAYPVGVLVVIGACYAFPRIWRAGVSPEGRRPAGDESDGEPPVNRGVCITRPEVTGVPVERLWRDPSLVTEDARHVVVSRLRRGGHQQIVTASTTFELGDVITLVGAPEALDRVTPRLGVPSDDRPEWDRSEIDFRRIFVSNRAVAGRRLRDLRLKERFGATVTRIKRGDVELVASAGTVLELGDRVRVVAPREQLEPLARFFGDSYRQLSEVDVPSLSLGIALGLLLGLVPLPLPGGTVLRLGFAGGPLVVALVLGLVGRTGPVVWVQPQNANLTLRQLGLVLFLAGVSTRSGYALAATLREAGGAIFLGATLVALVFSVVAFVVGYRWLRIPMPVLTGMVAGLQTQPATLAFATEQARSEHPNVGYAAVYPVAMVAKILLAQLLLNG
ncbi:aspartate:alanine exchanger family transporter [Limnochorda pilosa]|uniref:aspartate:alanine exchanger family transporter n=1 Tax=Limnochorda pilosa TaxID=1555112 RepID=UPI000AAE4390|nr:TrkA C-terminal domain-containing protein [Limnochorda pilosa]